MRFLKCLLSILALLCTLQTKAALEYTATDVDNGLTTLDEALSHRSDFISQRQARINTLHDSLLATPTSHRLIMSIAENYTAFNNDSALHYLSIGKNLYQGTDALPFIMRQMALMPLGGRMTEAEHLCDSLGKTVIPDEYIELYYECGRQMYSYISAFSDSSNKAMYREKAKNCQLKLLELLPKNTAEYKYNLGEYYFDNNEKGKARALLESVFEDEPEMSNTRARAAHHLSALALERNDMNAYVYYLSQAAIADVTAATREVAALQELGNYLHTTHDVDRSYTYLTQALANAVECGATMRMIESSRSLPIIERAKAAQLESKQHTIYAILVMVLIILIGLATSLLLLRREMKRMRELQTTLRLANKTKEVYISQFLSLCSIYMDKLNQFCKIANRKITTGKIDDLYKLTKSGKFVEEQSKEFYDVFDNAFLHLYPDFPAQVNALLRPDEQIELKDGEKMNTDLRILAFLRLGIEESTRIAQVLNYSINTIYAYRNRIKAKAINRSTFESDIMNIDSAM